MIFENTVILNKKDKTTIKFKIIANDDGRAYIDAFSLLNDSIAIRIDYLEDTNDGLKEKTNVMSTSSVSGLLTLLNESNNSYVYYQLGINGDTTSGTCSSVEEALVNLNVPNELVTKVLTIANNELVEQDKGFIRERMKRLYDDLSQPYSRMK